MSGWQYDAEIRQMYEDARTLKVSEPLYLQHKDLMLLGLEVWRRDYTDQNLAVYYEVVFPTREEAVQAAHHLGVALPPLPVLY